MKMRMLGIWEEEVICSVVAFFEKGGWAETWLSKGAL